MDYPKIEKIAILGGTGKEGQGLAYRWAKAGYSVIIGSRKSEKALAAVEELRQLCAGESVSLDGKENADAAAEGDIVVLTVPFGVHQAMLEEMKPFLKGKILIDVTVPLVPPRVSKVQMPEEGSAAQQAQAILGDDTVVVAAFQNVSFENLLKDGEPECDILVCGKKRDAREQVLGLVKDAGLTGWDAGYLENAVVVEGLTSVLIGLNKKYGTTSAGIRLTGLPRN
ncbi:MAG: NADPH-dependent F420 reductase [Anaerolineaceae bacterium]|nr:NADPH-dependent F420 reductase [Anaerolineaceae bacterium]